MRLQLKWAANFCPFSGSGRLRTGISAEGRGRKHKRFTLPRLACKAAPQAARGCQAGGAPGPLCQAWSHPHS